MKDQLRFALLLHLPNGHDAEAVRDAIIKRFENMPDELRKTLDWKTPAEKMQELINCVIL